MFKLLMAVLSVSLLFAFAQPVMAQEEVSAAPGQPGMDSMRGPDEDPGMDMGRDPEMAMMMSDMDDKGMSCSPGCKCDMCMKKKMGMGMGMGMMGMKERMMGMKGGMMGMHGDVDMMTWPKMNKSCRTPDYYLRHKDELDLTDAQVESLQKALVSAKKEAILKGAQVKALEMELGEMVSQPDFKLDAALAKLKEVEDARLELRTAMIKASSAARDMLSPEQLKKLKDMHMSKRGACCGKAGGGCCKSQGQPATAAPPDDMKQKMMEKMQKQMMQ
ncbi:MAG TPA: periplasmic heavy metal sensor [Nitrospirota bacterium]